VIVHTDGTLNVISAANDIGCGQRTLMAMIAAETLGIPYDQTAIAFDVDTDVTPNTGGTFGSRITNSGGWGVYEAAMDAKRQLLAGAAQKFLADEEIEVTPEELDIRDGLVFVKEDPDTQMTVADAVTSVVPNSPVIGRGAHFHPPDWTRLAFASHAAEVEVDTVTGTVKVVNYVAAHDVGRALNPKVVEEQIQGGVTMGLNAALFEGLFVDKATGLPITDNILEYKMISIHDVPRNIEVVIVEHPKEYGVYGAHGIGEPPLSVPPPTIMNAIYNAIGAWVESTPITRSKILAALGTA
jgi:CO/xanthine dehydrogenase Mo-binding subunit